MLHSISGCTLLREHLSGNCGVTFRHVVEEAMGGLLTCSFKVVSSSMIILERMLAPSVV